MSKVDQIEHEIVMRSPQKLLEFRDWFVEFTAKTWDHQIEKDMKFGRLGRVI